MLRPRSQPLHPRSPLLLLLLLLTWCHHVRGWLAGGGAGLLAPSRSVAWRSGPARAHAEAQAGARGQSICEKIDGDCPDNCTAAGFSGSDNFVARFNISPFNPSIEAVAAKADAYIKGAGAVHSVDDPSMGLHTSLFYFCCHTPQEKQGIKTALHKMEWSSLSVHYDSFACNLDHDNVTVYLHALPTDQRALVALATQIEVAAAQAGVPINHPRRSKFHMTLARVNHSYPTDDVVGHFLNDSASWDFGVAAFASFTVDAEVFRATDATTR